MTKLFSLICVAAALSLASCSGSANKTESATTATDAVQESTSLQGNWLLNSYRVDCVTTEFDKDSKYTLSFDEKDNSFGMTTDCNTIGGVFETANDSIRFKYVAVTEMACDNMIVEENMLRLFNDSTAYAIQKGDTLTFNAPSIGMATFIRMAE